VKKRKREIEEEEKNGGRRGIRSRFERFTNAQWRTADDDRWSGY